MCSDIPRRTYGGEKENDWTVLWLLTHPKAGKAANTHKHTLKGEHNKHGGGISRCRLSLSVGGKYRDLPHSARICLCVCMLCCVVCVYVCVNALRDSAGYLETATGHAASQSAGLRTTALSRHWPLISLGLITVSMRMSLCRPAPIGPIMQRCFELILHKQPHNGCGDKDWINDA